MLDFGLAKLAGGRRSGFESLTKSGAVVRRAGVHVAGASPAARRWTAAPISSPSAPAAVLPPANLPAAATSLVGRDADAAAVQALLERADVRWVTLTGPGGVGKTRLASHVARTMSDAFAGATYFVPLAGVADADHLVSSLVLMLDVHPGAGETPWVAVTRHLRALGAPLLLILDNFEQVWRPHRPELSWGVDTREQVTGW